MMSFTSEEMFPASLNPEEIAIHIPHLSVLVGSEVMLPKETFLSEQGRSHALRALTGADSVSAGLFVPPTPSPRPPSSPPALTALCVSVCFQRLFFHLCV